MTERKPADITFATWVDQQINEAAERGAFDNLPGTGKPLPGWGEADDGQSWLRNYLRKEGVSAEELLPAPLRLRKEAERLAGAVHLLGSEQAVRDVVADLNRRIMDWRRIPLGPPIFVPLVDEELTIRTWRDAQLARQPAASPAEADRAARERESARRRLRQRFRRRRRT